MDGSETRNNPHFSPDVRKQSVRIFSESAEKIKMTDRDKVAYEHHPAGMPMDETDMSLRYYLTEMSDDKIASYDPNMTDKELLEWDGNFRDDGNLMLVCVERDVNIVEYRTVLEEHIQLRRQ